MIDVYENELQSIMDTVQAVQVKYQGQENSGENLLRLQHEIVDRLSNLGFGAIVDVTPCLAGEPVTVSINERLDTTPFDSERKRWEVKKRIERGDPNPDEIEGAV